MIFSGRVPWGSVRPATSPAAAPPSPWPSPPSPGTPSTRIPPRRSPPAAPPPPPAPASPHPPWPPRRRRARTRQEPVSSTNPSETSERFRGRDKESLTPNWNSEIFSETLWLVFCSICSSRGGLICKHFDCVLAGAVDACVQLKNVEMSWWRDCVEPWIWKEQTCGEKTLTQCRFVSRPVTCGKSRYWTWKTHAESFFFFYKKNSMWLCNHLDIYQCFFHARDNVIKSKLRACLNRFYERSYQTKKNDCRTVFIC